MTEFKKAHINNTEEFIRVVHEAEAYVCRRLKSSRDGIFSDEVKGCSRDNLYVGNAGILHMYTQLNMIEPSPEYEKIIKQMTKYLNIHLFDGIETAHKEGEFVDGMAEAFYSGIGGIGLVLNEVYRLSGDENARNGALRVIRYYTEHAVHACEGIYWSDNSVIFFDAGITLFLIDSLNTYKERKEELTKLIMQSCDYILSKSVRHADGGLEFGHLKVEFKRGEPNFEFGTAGVGYLFAKAYEVTGRTEYLEAAGAAGKYLKSIAVPQKKGYLIPYKPDKFPGLFYLGNCHGPVGTAKLFYELHRITGKREYLEEVILLCEGAMSLGAPFAMSDGFWNTTCVCCGPAGYVPLFAGLYRETGDSRWKKLAHMVGEVLVGTETKDDSEDGTAGFWRIAFDRTRPDELSAPAGYFTGAAGIAVSLLQVYCMERENIHAGALIDDPYNK